jgi:hypothetical protein
LTLGESVETQTSERFLSLRRFTSIYGIGPTKARELYSRGLRTFRDLEKYYDVPESADDITVLDPDSHIPRGKLPELTIKVGLSLRHEFEKTISRDGVKLIRKVIMDELATLHDGFISTIVGGLVFIQAKLIYGKFTNFWQIQTG